MSKTKPEDVPLPSHLGDFIQRQATASAKLNSCTTLQDIMGVFAEYLIPNGQSVVISRFLYDEVSAFAGLKKHAYANSQETFESKQILNVTLSDIAPLRPSIDDWETVIINDFVNAEGLSAEAKAWIGNENTQSIVVFPLMAMGNVVGMVHITNDNTPFDLSDTEQHLYQTTINQIGTLVHGLGLYGELPTSFTRATQLVAINRAISRAQDYPEMVEILLSEIPEPINLVGIALLDRPVTSGQIPSTATVRVVATSQGIVEPNIIDTFPSADQRMFTIVDTLLKGEPTVIADTRENEESIVPNGTQYLNELGAYSFLTVGLKSGMRLFGMLICGTEKPLELDDLQMNHILAYADQVAVTIDNHRLLDQTAEALSLVQHQYETANSLYHSQTPEDMLIALYDFAKDYFNDAHIAVIESGDTDTLQVIAEIKNGEVIAGQRQSSLGEYGNFEFDSSDEPDDNEHYYDDFEEVTNSGIKGYLSTPPPPDTNPKIDEEMRKLLADVTEKRQLVIPIRAAGEHLVGVLKFSNSTSIEMPFNRSRALRSLIDQLALILENRRLLETTGDTLSETRILYALSHEMFAADSGIDLLHALKKHLVPTAHSLSLLSIDWREGSYDVTSIVLDAFLDNADKAIEPFKELLNPDDTESIEAYKGEWALQGDQIEFVDNLELLLEERPAIQSALDAGLRAHIVIPFQENGLLRQQIHIPFKTPQHFDEQIRRLFQAARDQITIILKNRQLLRETEKSLEDVQTLYTTTSELMTRQEGVEILRVLRNQFAQDASSVMMYSLEWDFASDELLSFTHDCIITQEEELFPETALHEQFSEEELQELQQDWENLGYGIDIVPNIEAILPVRPALQFLLDFGVQSYVTLPIFEDNYQIQRIVVAYDKPHIFTGRDRSMYATIRDQISIIMQNRRLLHDTQVTATQLGSRVGVLQALNSLSANLLSASDEKALLQQTAEAIVTSLSVRHVAVILVDEAERVSANLAVEYPEILGADLPTQMDSTIQEILFNTSSPIIIDNIDDDMRLSDDLRSSLQNHGIKAVTFIPLLDPSGELIGTVRLGAFDDDTKLDREMVDIAQTIVNQVAVTLQNIRLLDDTRRQTDQLQHIANYSQSIQTIFDLRELLEITIAELIMMVRQDTVDILLFDSADKVMRHTAWHKNGRVNVEKQGDMISLDDTTAGRVWNTRTSLYVSDLSQRPDLTHSHRKDIKSIMSFPIFSRGAIIGILEIGNVISNQYNNSDVAIIQQLVNQLSVAIETAETYTQNQRLAKSKARVNEIATELQQQTDIDRILSVTMSELGKALGAQKARIRLGKPSDQNGDNKTE